MKDVANADSSASRSPSLARALSMTRSVRSNNEIWSISADPTIYIIDDDAGVRDSLALLLGLHSLRVAVFACAEDFFSACNPHSHGCILLDIRMPGMGGLELQRQLMVRGIRLPVIVMTAHGNVAASRTAFKAGAVDFLSKPISETELLDAVREALALCQEDGKDVRIVSDAQIRIDRLTAREKDVLGLLVDGLSSRETAERLAISPRTVEVYKARMMEKLCARKLSDLMKIALLTQQQAKLS